ncbi:LysR family transcriptional regulator [Thalassomonas viridans]|uniref:LysR family transcriptional regulator n=1 Tax=Thalassomonas viridans TaxID=137584 RepID=A0AAE9ZA30_9GAMM|nr:LysR family transcriptional regulator [Thalassomonas viridans]WDE07802.1 LysR family transcriptional regulator [Thalassomonas viridans]
MDKIRALQYFKRAAELNSFSLAAKEFDVPPSSVSRRVKDLEQVLGFELLKRSTRHVSTTELGQVYYQMITEVLQKLNEADELVSHRMGVIEGKIRISALPGYGARVLAPVLRRFRQQYPGITLELNYSDQVVLLGQDAVDIAIRVGAVVEERVIARHLTRSSFKLVATPELLAQLQATYGKEKLGFEELKTCPCIQIRSPRGLIDWWQQEDDDWQKIPISPVLTCNDSETILDAVLAGEGLLISALWEVQEALASGELVEVPTEKPVSYGKIPEVDLFILYQQGKYQIPKIKHCVDFLIRHLGDKPPV